MKKARIGSLVGIESGFTLLELIITLAIISVLAVGTIPVARNLVKREKEKELRRNLREIRQAIDAYHSVCVQGLVHPLDRRVEDNYYPPKLEILVEGVHLVNPRAGPMGKADTLVHFLRRIPNDPFTGKPDWGLRSAQDDPDSTSWGGQNVYNVYSTHPGIALDGKTRYKDW